MQPVALPPIVEEAAIGDPFVVWSAALRGDTAVLDRLLASSPAPSIGSGVRGWSVLYAAATRGHAAAVSRLLAHGANADAPVASTGWTPLMSAAHQGHADVVRLLLEKGASTSARNGNGHSAFDLARVARVPSAAVMQLLEQPQRVLQQTPQNAAGSSSSSTRSGKRSGGSGKANGVPPLGQPQQPPQQQQPTPPHQQPSPFELPTDYQPAHTNTACAPSCSSHHHSHGQAPPPAQQCHSHGTQHQRSYAPAVSPWYAPAAATPQQSQSQPQSQSQQQTPPQVMEMLSQLQLGLGQLSERFERVSANTAAAQQPGSGGGLGSSARSPSSQQIVQSPDGGVWACVGGPSASQPSPSEKRAADDAVAEKRRVDAMMMQMQNLSNELAAARAQSAKAEQEAAGWRQEAAGLRGEMAAGQPPPSLSLSLSLSLSPLSLSLTFPLPSPSDGDGRPCGAVP